MSSTTARNDRTKRSFKSDRGEPTGDLIVLDGQVNAYLATPPKLVESQNVGILYVPDIFGIWQNSKLMADLFAAQGYTTLVLDIFNCDPAPVQMPEDFDIMGWLSHGSNGSNPHTPEAIDPIILKGIAHLKSLGLSYIGAVGYCLGAKVRRCSSLFLAWCLHTIEQY